MSQFGGGGGGSGGKFGGFNRETRCRFTRDGVTHIDFKDVGVLQKLLTNQGKMFSRKRSGNSAHFQRLFKLAVKRARFMALLPYSE